MKEVFCLQYSSTRRTEDTTLQFSLEVHEAINQIVYVEKKIPKLAKYKIPLTTLRLWNSSVTSL